MSSTKQEQKEVQEAFDSIRPDGAPWKLIQDWTDLPDTVDPVVQEQVWQHSKTDETMKNQRGKPKGR